MAQITPFVRLADFFDNVVRDAMDNITGDCKVCKTNQVKIFTHSCWRKIREESKVLYAKEEENQK